VVYTNGKMLPPSPQCALTLEICLAETNEAALLTARIKSFLT
jgi:hypothetical protein